MSQRECAGFNWPPASIPAQEPVSISPQAVCRAGPGSNVNACSLSGLLRVCSARCARNSGEPLAECQSLAFGVAQPETNAAVFRLLSLLPAALLPFCAGVPAIGVGQPANDAQPGRRSVPCDGPPFGPSCWQGVGQPAICATKLKSVRLAPIFAPFAIDLSFRATNCSGVPPASQAVGVGHPVEPVPDVRGTDARSRKRDRPEGVTHGLHVILYKVDP
ncbi:hypothetical protein, partial [Ralstonia pseudosolanacearum]|uniref:hypothetical protein n=3 Tax=Ralstonia pseudosolanacearum TaxID=1310165 RepID=UPI00352371F1